MRLVFTSDIHVDLNGPAVLEALAERIRAVGADVALVSGDIATGAPTWLQTLLTLKEAAPEVLVVAGNHDVWCHPELQAKGVDSWAWLDKLLPALCAEAGARLLDQGPVRLGRTGFAGTLGWYDLTTREHLLDAPLEAYRTGRWGGMVWNDHTYARWNDEAGRPMLAEAVAGRLRERFSVHLESLDAPQVVVATHMLLFEGQIHRKAHPGWRFANGFMGSYPLGERIQADPRVTLTISGHTHLHSDLRLGRLRAMVSPLGYRREWLAPNPRDAVARSLQVIDLPGD